MVVHELAVGATVEWYTPPDLFASLGVTFDLDPAGAPAGLAPWVPARRIRTKIADGLSTEWEGHVWLNPPYGPAGVAFIDRMIAHGDGLLLLPSRTETAAYQRCLYAADAVCLLRERLWFVRSDGFKGRSSFGSTLFAFGPWATAVLAKADLGWRHTQMVDVATVEPHCYFCGETEIIQVGCYTRLDFGAGGIQLCCDNCFEKADWTQRDLEPQPDEAA